MGFRAADLMTTKVICVFSDMELRELAGLFLDKKISGAPVTSRDGRLEGVVSQTDLLRHNVSRDTELVMDSDFYDSVRIEGSHLPRGYQIVDTASGIVADIMTPLIHSVTEQTTVEEVARIMREKRVHRVIVMRDGKVAGLISALDLLAVLSTVAAPRRVKAK